MNDMNDKRDERVRLSRALIAETMVRLECGLETIARRERATYDEVARQRAAAVTALLEALHHGALQGDPPAFSRQASRMSAASSSDASEDASDALNELASVRDEAYWSRRACDELRRACANLERLGALID